MKICKKLLAITIALVLLVSTLVSGLVVSAADATTTLAIGTTTIKEGTTTADVEFVLTFAAPTKTPHSLCTITAADGLTLTAIEVDQAKTKYVKQGEDGQWVDDELITDEEAKVTISNDGKNLAAGKVLVESAADSKAPTVTSITFVATFAVAEGLAEGTYAVSAEADATNWGEDDIAVTVTAGAVVVEAAAPECDHANAELVYDVVDGNCVTTKVCPCGEYEEIIATITNPGLLHAPVLDAGLEINFRIKDTDAVGYSDIYAVIEKDGYYDTVLGAIDSTTDRIDSVVNGNRLQFNYTGISAKQMNNGLNTRVYGTNEKGQVILLAAEDGYTLVTYIKSQYNLSQVSGAQAGTKMAAYRTLLVDLANYGAQAQLYLDYNTDNLANETIDQTYASEIPTSYANDLTTTGINIRRAPDLGNKVLVNLRLNHSDVASYGEDFKLTVLYKDTTGAELDVVYTFEDFVENGTTWQVAFDKVSPATMAVPFTAILTDGSGNEVGKLVYSIESYCNTVANGATQYPAYAAVLPLTQALTAYGRSADAYFNF